MSEHVPVPRMAVIYHSHVVHHAENKSGIPFEVIHDYDSNANHRLRTIHGASSWAHYRDIAVLVVGEIGKTFHGYTDYFGESVLEVRALLCPERA